MISGKKAGLILKKLIETVNQMGKSIFKKRNPG